MSPSGAFAEFWCCTGIRGARGQPARQSGALGTKDQPGRRPAPNTLPIPLLHVFAGCGSHSAGSGRAGWDPLQGRAGLSWNLSGLRTQGLTRFPIQSSGRDVLGTGTPRDTLTMTKPQPRPFPAQLLVGLERKSSHTIYRIGTVLYFSFFFKLSRNVFRR